MHTLIKSAWSSGIILLLTLSGPLGTALYSQNLVGLDTALFGAPVHAQENSTDNTFTATVPAVSVEALTVTLSPTSGEVTGSFNAVNYDSAAANDLRYKISLIDPAPAQKNNEFTAEAYNVYDEVISVDALAIAGDSAKPVTFTYHPPAVPTGEYRIRVRLTTSHDDQLGWSNATVTLTNPDAQFARVEPINITLDQAPVGLDIVQPDGYDPLQGVTITATTNVTLNYRVTNIGSSPITAAPRLAVRTWGALGDTVATHDAPPVTLPNEESIDGTLTFTPPTTPTAYQLELALYTPTGERISSLAEYRVVVAGTSGRILSARLENASDNSLTFATEVVGPADRTSEILASVTASLRDGDSTLATVTTDPITLGAAGSQVVVFTLPFEQALASPTVHMALITSDGVALDTYDFSLDTTTLFERSTLQELDVRSLSNSLLGIVILIIVVLGIIISFFYLRRSKNTGPPMSGTILLVLSLGLTTAIISQSVQAQGPGGEYYYRSNPNSVVSVFINRPIHNNDIENPNQVYLNGRIPIEAEVTYTHCANRTSFGGLAIDQVKAGGHTIPTTADWVPFHNLFPSGLVEGPINIPASYTGNAADADKYNVLTNTEVIHQRFTPDGPRHNTYSGIMSVDPLLTDLTLRITGYAGQWTGGGSHRPMHGWFGAYTHLTLGAPTPVPTPTPTATSAPTPTVPPTPEPRIPTANFTVPPYAFVGNSVQAISTSSTGTSAPWQNQENPLDVNNDGSVSPGDSIIINETRNGSRKLPAYLPPTFYVDVNGDNTLGTEDRTLIIDYLNALESGTTPTIPAKTGGTWQNQANPLDVNTDGFISPIDVNIINTHESQYGFRRLTPPPQPFMDVNGDGKVSLADSQLVQDAITNGTTTGFAPCCSLRHVWQIINTTTDTDITPTANTGTSIAITPTAPATLLFRLTVTSDQGLSNTAEKVVQILPAAATPTCPAPYYDVNGDGQVSPADVTAISQYLDGLALSPAANGAQWQNQNAPLDVNADGFVSPIDALQIINYRNNNGRATLPRIGSTCRAITTTSPPPTCPAPYLDVNGDGLVTAVDLLIIINYQNNQDQSPIAVTNAPWQNGNNPRDVNNDGKVSGKDQVLLISYLNAGYSADIGTHSCTITTGGITPPPVPNTPPTCPAPFIDVNGDNHFSPIDILVMINATGQTPPQPPKTGAPWQNQDNPLDVNDDGTGASTIDMLNLMNYKNSGFPTTLPAPTACTSPNPIPASMFSCQPGNQSALVGQQVTVAEDPFEGHFNASWSAPGATPSNGTGRSFQTTYPAPGDYLITATSLDFPGATKTAECTVTVSTETISPSPTPTARATFDPGTIRQID